MTRLTSRYRSGSRCAAAVCISIAVVMLATAEDNSVRDEPAPAKKQAVNASSPKLERAPAEKPESSASESESAHPLDWALEYATSQAEHIENNISDYSCRLIKRERIDGKLQPYHFAKVLVRCERREEGHVVKPMALYMQFYKPDKLKDRRVLYIDGENDGRVLVRKGGKGLEYLRLRLDPNGTAARRESNYPVTDLGFSKIIRRLIQSIKDDIEHDPLAENTRVQRFGNAKVGDRICTHIQVVHPESNNETQFHRASLFIDDELKVPIRLVVYGWPEQEDEKPPVIEEYMYVDLKLNVGLTDEDFSDSKLD